MTNLVALLLAAAASNLNATDESLTATTTSTAATDITVNYVDFTTSSGANISSGEQVTNFTTATTSTILAAPSAGTTTRSPSLIKVCNKGSTAQSVTIQYAKTAGSLSLRQAVLSLAGGECATIGNDGSQIMTSSSGVPRVQADAPGYSGRSFEFSKSCTAYDTVGYHLNCANGTGFPGAFTIGTPGVNGAVRDCSTAAGALITGSHVLPNPATGGWYLTRFGTNANVVGTYGLIDVLWQNTGLAVAAGAQAIVTPTWPARDREGSTNGEGVRIAIQVLGTLGNAAAIATSTITYVNSNGDTARTGTLSGAVGFQMPATALIGTWIPFTLQAGDTGVRSISSFNSGTTYTSGTYALAAYRTLAVDGVGAANYPSGSLVSRAQLNPGVRVWNGTCFNFVGMGAIATTAPLLTSGTIELMER